MIQVLDSALDSAVWILSSYTFRLKSSCTKVVNLVGRDLFSFSSNQSVSRQCLFGGRSQSSPSSVSDLILVWREARVHSSLPFGPLVPVLDLEFEGINSLPASSIQLIPAVQLCCLRILFSSFDLTFLQDFW